MEAFAEFLLAIQAQNMKFAKFILVSHEFQSKDT